MFPTLDRDLRFGYQTNGSLVLATNETEVQILKNLMKRGEINGVKRLQLLNQTQVLDMEPGVNPNTIAALFAPDAGNVIPYEYAIALAENAVDNGVEVRIRREVVAINKKQQEEQIGDLFDIQLRHWEPSHYVESKQKYQTAGTTAKIIMGSIFLSTSVMVGLGVTMALDSKLPQETRHQSIMAVLVLLVSGILAVVNYFYKSTSTSGGDGGRGYAAAGAKLAKMATKQVVDMCQPLEGKKGGSKVNVEEMFTGGSGSIKAVKGVVVGEEQIQAKYIINCAGGASDKIANMIGDYSFKIKPRLGDYLLLNRNQVRFFYS
jgi:L-2-hydroxyglutarate oxidase LhgO